MNNILIFQNRPGIGDCIIFLSAIHEIARKNQGAKIFLVTKKRSKARELLKDDPYIKNILYSDENEKRHKIKVLKYLYLWKDLHKIKFIKSYIFHHSFGHYFLCKILNIKHIFHYGFIKKNENICKKIYISILKWLNIKNYNSSAKIFLEKIQKNNKNNLIIGIGSSGLSRRWDMKNFVKLINLINKKKYNFYIVAGKNESEEAKILIKKLKHKVKIKSLCSKKIYEILTYIKNSKLYIGTDSAFMHISAALGVKSFGLFGDTPTNYAEYSKKIFPIIPLGYSTITHKSNAMNKISAEHVYSKIKKFI